MSPTRRSATRSARPSRSTACRICWSLGAKEVEANNISVRDRKGETTAMSLEDFTAKVVGEIKNKTFNV